MISRVHSLEHSGRARGGHGVRARDVLRGDGRSLGGADRGGGRRDGDRLRGDHALPGRGAARRRPHLRARRRPRRTDGARPRHDGAPGSPPPSRRPPSSSPRAFRDELATPARTSSRTVCRAYRLVRREDVELADALPGRSSGLTTCRLVDGTLGSTHMALTLVSLADGHVDEHLHSFETSFYVLEGEPVLYLEGRGVTLEPGACGAHPGRRAARVSLRRAARSGSRWPRRGRVSDGSDTFFLGPAPDSAPAAARRPRSAQPQPLPAQRTARWISTA